MAYSFPFERLEVFALALAVARWVRRQKWPTGMAHLKDQGVRAADSMVLNIAEGAGRGGGAGTNHFRIASGSAAELGAVLLLVDFPGGTERVEELRRVCAMLYRMRGR